MKLFWKIFSVVFISFIVTVSLISYITSDMQIRNEEGRIIEENRILSSFIAKEVEIGYLESKWPFETLNKLSKRDDFIFWWVVTGDGIIHLSNNASFVNSDAYSYFPELPKMKRDEGLFVDQNSRFGILIAPLKIGTEDWSFWLGFSMKKTSEIIRDVTIVNLLIFLFSVAAIGFVLYLTTVYFTRPVGRLLEGTKAVARGDLDYKIKVKAKDELGKLASAFNQMTADLKQSHEQIRKHAEELEQKVADRTKELDMKIKELTDTKTAVLNMMEDTDETNKELVETQEELKRSLEELKNLDVKKDEFISIAAHELKTPLTSIHGFSQLLQNRDVAKNPEKREKYLKIMDSETKRLAKLVNDILDLSRIDLGTFKLNLEGVEITKLMEDVGREMNVQMKEKGLESEYNVDKKLSNIITDKERLTEILINLINNAVKYTPEGKITVKVSRENDFVHFVVKDTGIGIAKEYHDKLFRRFYQVDSSYTRKAGGVGLGLALCKELTTLLGGKIWFESEPGNGSEFHFTIPIKSLPKKQMSEEETRARERLEKSEDVRKKLGLKQDVVPPPLTSSRKKAQA
jgi:signal transduction histidine kinase